MKALTTITSSTFRELTLELDLSEEDITLFPWASIETAFVSRASKTQIQKEPTVFIILSLSEEVDEFAGPGDQVYLRVRDAAWEAMPKLSAKGLVRVQYDVSYSLVLSMRWPYILPSGLFCPA